MGAAPGRTRADEARAPSWAARLTSLRARGLTRKEAAAELAIDQPKVSHLLRGRLAGFSTDRLMGFLTAMGRDVEIVVKVPPRSRRRGRMRVVAA